MNEVNYSNIDDQVEDNGSSNTMSTFMNDFHDWTLRFNKYYVGKMLYNAVIFAGPVSRCILCRLEKQHSRGVVLQTSKSDNFKPGASGLPLCLEHLDMYSIPTLTVLGDKFMSPARHFKRRLRIARADSWKGVRFEVYEHDMICYLCAKQVKFGLQYIKEGLPILDNPFHYYVCRHCVRRNGF